MTPVQLTAKPAGYRPAILREKSCANCRFFSAKVIGPDGPQHGKCFVAHEDHGHVFTVDAGATCDYHETEGE